MSFMESAIVIGKAFIVVLLFAYTGVVLDNQDALERGGGFWWFVSGLLSLFLALTLTVHWISQAI